MKHVCKICNREITPGTPVQEVQSGVLVIEGVETMGKPVVYHSNCFQKNFSTPKATLNLIKRIATERKRKQ